MPKRKPSKAKSRDAMFTTMKILEPHSEGLTYSQISGDKLHYESDTPLVTWSVMQGVEEGVLIQDKAAKPYRYRLSDQGVDWLERYKE